MAPPESRSHRQMDFDPSTYNSRYADTILSIRTKRSEATKRLSHHQQSLRGEPLLTETASLNDICHVALLGTSSRGGSSVTASILSRQGEGTTPDQRKILTLPGEITPHLQLSGLYPPFTDSDYVDLTKEDVTLNRTKTFLQNEILSEIGYPLSQTSDLEGFAHRLYGRLILQWPHIAFDFEQIHNILGATVNTFNDSGAYHDTKLYRTELLKRLSTTYPGVKPQYYDGISREGVNPQEVVGPPHPYLIEVPPFIIPSPWHHATQEELRNGVFLMKDPADAWRLPFWKAIFPHAQQDLLHLTRDPREAMNGICDGWNDPHGYFSVLSPHADSIPGYTPHGTQSWQKDFLSYSVPMTLGMELLHGNPNLEEIAGIQWAEAHRAILEFTRTHPDDYNYTRIENPLGKEIGFSWIKADPQAAFAHIAKILDVPMTASLSRAAKRLPTTPVMQTPGTEIHGSRWEKTTNAAEIAAVADRPYVKAVADALGYHY